MHEPPARAIGSVTRYVVQVAEDAAAEAVDDHEHRCHAIPPPRRDPVTAIPFADVEFSDDQVSHVIEMLADHDDTWVARRLGIPLMALQRALADYERRHGTFLFKRRTTG